MAAAPRQDPQGPLPPQLAPKGPYADLVLPADIPGAFTDCPPQEPCDVYFNIGALGLLRQPLGHGDVAFENRHDKTHLDLGIRPEKESELRPIQTYNDASPSMGWGVEGTLGYEWGDNAVELTGFYIFSNKGSSEVDSIGRIDLPFTHPPLGFEGDNGLWLEADRNRISFEQALGNAEFNYRWWNMGISGAQGILGLRYTDLEERLSIFTGDDDLTVHDIHGFPDPTREATYRVQSHNHVVAPQFGFEWNTPVCSWVSFSWTAKAAVGANFLDVNYTLTRGDGLVGRAVTRFDTLFAQEYETGVYLDFWLFPGGRLRAGYDLFWAVGVAEAAEQVDFNLAHQGLQPIRQGSVLYHGPLVEMEFLF
jgi:hypothetical protein